MKRTMLCLLSAALLLGAWTVFCGAVEAKPSGQTIYVDTKPVTCATYEIDGNCYVKLRDLAVLLKDSNAEFSVDWDGTSQTVVVSTGKKYTPTGGELQALSDTNAPAAVSTHALKIDGRDVSNLTGVNIGGSNYYSLDRLSMWLYFETDYDKDNNRIGILTVQMTGCELPFADFYGTQTAESAATAEPDRC